MSTQKRQVVLTLYVPDRLGLDWLPHNITVHGISRNWVLLQAFLHSSLAPKAWLVQWWARQVSNLRPTGYEPVALPLSYGPPES